MQEKGAVGAVVMNTYDPFYESFEIVDDDKKDDYNVFSCWIIYCR